jgi:hypothetical protein
MQRLREEAHGEVFKAVAAHRPVLRLPNRKRPGIATSEDSHDGMGASGVGVAGDGEERSAVGAGHRRYAAWVRVPVAEIVEAATCLRIAAGELGGLPLRVGIEAIAAVLSTGPRPDGVRDDHLVLAVPIAEKQTARLVRSMRIGFGDKQFEDGAM